MYKLLFFSFFMLVATNYLVVTESAARNYTTNNGYEVELNWKVRHKDKLIVWGSVKEGEACQQLRVHIGMRHKDGWYRNFRRLIKKPHTKNSRSTFKFEYEHHSKTMPKKKWAPDMINITCSNFYVN